MPKRTLAMTDGGLRLVEQQPVAAAVPDEVMSPIIGKVMALAAERGESPKVVLDELIASATKRLGMPAERLRSVGARRPELRLLPSPTSSAGTPPPPT